MIKNSKKIIVGVALAVIGASAFFGVTNSKYTNTISGNGETEIAKVERDVGAVQGTASVWCIRGCDKNVIFSACLCILHSGGGSCIILIIMGIFTQKNSMPYEENVCMRFCFLKFNREDCI